MSKQERIKEVFAAGDGILRMVPNFVPRSFNKPGRRIKLHPGDYFAYGMDRGAITERWFSSVVAAANGPLTSENEGMSYVSLSDDKEDKVLFKEVIELLGAEIVGEELFAKYGTFPIFAKFFDNEDALFHHLHPTQEMADAVGRAQKPEAYFFPVQLNNHLGNAPYTYFGFDPSVSKEEVKARTAKFRSEDTRITELSRAFRCQLGTGWYTPPGVIHAPASLCTYEPQWNADCNAVFENVTAGSVNAYDSLVEQCPEDKKEDLDYIMQFLDWEKNVDPDYRAHYFRPPVAESAGDGYVQNWIVYGNPYIGGKELTVAPGKSVLIRDDACYGCILVEGHGKFGAYPCETPSLIRFGELTCDEFFVSEAAAKKGVRVTNESKFENLVILKHFGPNAGAPCCD